MYKIHIQAHYYNPYRSPERFITTGVLIREPNIVLTTRYYDENGEDFFDKAESRGHRLVICEQEFDPAAAPKTKEQEDKEKTADTARYERYKKDLASEQKPKDKDKDWKKEYEERHKKNQEFDKPSTNCVLATVKKSDASRQLVLLEAQEKLTLGGVPVFNSQKPVVGTSIKTYGFSKAADEFMPRRSSSQLKQRLRLVPSETTGTIIKDNTDQKEGEGFILHQAPVAEGSWGGPVVNTCGQVIGLNFRQQTEQLIKAEGSTKPTGKNTGEAKVEKVKVPISNVVGAVGSGQLIAFAELNGVTVVTSNAPCIASMLSFSMQPNMWTVFVGGSALLLAAASMVVALRRPGPVRNTVARFLPGMARSREATFEAGYGGYDSGAANHHRGGTDYTPHAATPPIETLPATPPPGSHPRAEPTRIMAEASDSDWSASLIPVGGGASISLDAIRVGADGLVLGRDSDCDVVTNNSTVSKRHARIKRTQNGKLQIEDLGSANGTWRGRTRIQSEAFGNGDVVRFGSLEYRIEVASKNGNTGPTLFATPVRSWMLSGEDENGRVLQWLLQPIVDASGRPVETTWIVGRNADRADKVLADKRVSGEHAKMRFTPQRGLEICDLNSSNGTKVDGSKISDSYVAIDEARIVEFGGSKMSLTRTT